MTLAELAFGATEAREYEAWFETPDGRRADAQEQALLSRLLSGFGSPGTLLEVGCGTGHFLRWFEALGWRGAGVDISPPMLAEARRRNPDAGLVRSDGEALPFADESWDVVAIITMLEFAPDPVRVLGEALRVSRRGALLGVLNRWSWLAAQRRVQGWFGPTPYDTARFFSTGQIRRLLAAVGPAGRPLRIESGSALGSRLFPAWGAFLGVAAIKSERGEEP
jgi:SAM-dependent methyltransferase